MVSKKVVRSKKRVAQKFSFTFQIDVKAPSEMVRKLIEKGVVNAMKDLKAYEGYERGTKISVKCDGDLIGEL